MGLETPLIFLLLLFTENPSPRLFMSKEYSDLLIHQMKGNKELLLKRLNQIEVRSKASMAQNRPGSTIFRIPLQDFTNNNILECSRDKDNHFRTNTYSCSDNDSKIIKPRIFILKLFFNNVNWNFLYE